MSASDYITTNILISATNVQKVLKEIAISSQISIEDLNKILKLYSVQVKTGTNIPQIEFSRTTNSSGDVTTAYLKIIGDTILQLVGDVCSYLKFKKEGITPREFTTNNVDRIFYISKESTQSYMQLYLDDVCVGMVYEDSFLWNGKSYLKNADAFLIYSETKTDEDEDAISLINGSTIVQYNNYCIQTANSNSINKKLSSNASCSDLKTDQEEGYNFQYNNKRSTYEYFGYIKKDTYIYKGLYTATTLQQLEKNRTYLLYELPTYVNSTVTTSISYDNMIKLQPKEDSFNFYWYLIDSSGKSHKQKINSSDYDTSSYVSWIENKYVTYTDSTGTYCLYFTKYPTINSSKRTTSDPFNEVELNLKSTRPQDSAQAYITFINSMVRESGTFYKEIEMPINGLYEKKETAPIYSNDWVYTVRIGEKYKVTDPNATIVNTYYILDSQYATTLDSSIILRWIQVTKDYFRIDYSSFNDLNKKTDTEQESPWYCDPHYGIYLNPYTGSIDHTLDTIGTYISLYSTQLINHTRGSNISIKLYQDGAYWIQSLSKYKCAYTIKPASLARNYTCNIELNSFTFDNDFIYFTKTTSEPYEYVVFESVTKINE